MYSYWKKDIVQWQMAGKIYLSIPFTWLIPKAQKIIQESKKPVIIGGPAIIMNQDLFDKKHLKPLPEGVSPIQLHNPFATFTTRGCPNKCKFCAVPKIEGNLVELNDFPVRPLICDNNFLASSRKHFDFVIDRLKILPYVDFNQGLDHRLLSNHHLDGLCSLKKVKVRFAFDNISSEAKVIDAINRTKKSGLKDIQVYVLIGFNDTPDDTLYRLNKVLELGCLPNAMRYQPLDSLQENSYLNPNWDETMMHRIMRYYNKTVWLGHIKFEDYHPGLPSGGFFF